MRLVTGSLLMSAVCITAAGQATTYRLVNYPSLQNGLTIDGSIVANGGAGAGRFETTNFISAAWTIKSSDGVEVFSAAPEDIQELVLVDDPNGGIAITPSELSLGGANVTFASIRLGTANAALEYVFSDIPSRSRITAFGPSGLLWSGFPSNDTLAGGKLVFARAIPEPNALLLHLWAMICCLRRPNR